MQGVLTGAADALIHRLCIVLDRWMWGCDYWYVGLWDVCYFLDIESVLPLSLDLTAILGLACSWSKTPIYVIVHLPLCFVVSRPRP